MFFGVYKISNLNQIHFTTAGPLVIHDIVSWFETVPDPGDKLYLNVSSKNEGSINTITNIKAKMIVLDKNATINSDW